MEKVQEIFNKLVSDKDNTLRYIVDWLQKGKRRIILWEQIPHYYVCGLRRCLADAPLQLAAGHTSR